MDPPLTPSSLRPVVLRKSDGLGHRLGGLPSLANLRPLHGAVYQAADCPTTPLTRLLLGHSADTHYRVGYRVAVQVLRAATLHPHVHRRWTTAQSQGPIPGWTAVAPWSFEHAAARLLLSLTPIARPRRPSHSSIYPSTSGPWSSTASARRGVPPPGPSSSPARPIRSATFLGPRPRLGCAWPGPPGPPPGLPGALISAPSSRTTGSLRPAFTQHQPVPPCAFCGNPNPDRHHEWRCTSLRTTAFPIGQDPLSACLAWPRVAQPNERGPCRGR